MEPGRGRNGAGNFTGKSKNNKNNPLLQLPTQSPEGQCQHQGSNGNVQAEARGSFQCSTKLDQLKLITELHLTPPRKGVPRGPLPPGLAPRPEFSLPGSNFSARGSVDFQTREVTVASCSVCASNAKQEQLVAHNNMHCVSEQHNKQFARQPGDIRTILYNREERKEEKNM